MSSIDAAQRQKAVDAMAKAWAAADEAGVPADVIAGVALAKAYSELVKAMGLETAANIAARFPEQIKAGRFGGNDTPDTPDQTS